jgi:hypothetical protein
LIDIRGPDEHAREASPAPAIAPSVRLRFPSSPVHSSAEVLWIGGSLCSSSLVAFVEALSAPQVNARLKGHRQALAGIFATVGHRRRHLHRRPRDCGPAGSQLTFLAPNIRAPHAVFDPLSWVLLARPRDMW